MTGPEAEILPPERVTHRTSHLHLLSKVLIFHLNKDILKYKMSLEVGHFAPDRFFGPLTNGKGYSEPEIL